MAGLHCTAWCPCCLIYTRSFIYSLHVCVSESEAPLSDVPEQLLDPGLISLLRAELGLSSPDLFSMAVTDYDIKSSVRTFSPAFLLFYYESSVVYFFSFSAPHLHTCSHLEAGLFYRCRIVTSSAKTSSNHSYTCV